MAFKKLEAELSCRKQRGWKMRKGVGRVRVNVGMKRDRWLSLQVSGLLLTFVPTSLPVLLVTALTSMEPCGRSLHHNPQMRQEKGPCPASVLPCCLWSNISLIHAAEKLLKVTAPPLQNLPYLGVGSHTASKLPSLALLTCPSDWELGSSTVSFREHKVMLGSQKYQSKLVLSGCLTLARLLSGSPTAFFLPEEDNKNNGLLSRRWK